VIQGLFRNPLADPGLIGVSGGAALGAASILVLGGDLMAFSFLPFNWVLPFAAFTGGLAATLTVMAFSWSGMMFSVTSMLLVGLALNTMATGGIGLLTALSDQDSFRNLTFWLLGSVGSADAEKVLISAMVIIPAVLLLLRDAMNLDCLLLGDSSARSLGIPVSRLKFRLVFLSAFIVGTSVAFTGMIGFVGLIVPNLLRFVVGPLHRWLMPASAIFGALILVTADLLARSLWFPRELPIGVLTSLIGAPIFIFLIGLQRKKGLL
jgi:iron complex transport system permease protein